MANEDEPQPPEPPPQHDVALTPEQMNRYVDFINLKAVSPEDACAVCGSSQNFVGEHFFRVETLKEQFVFGGRAMPLFVTVCHNCGFVRMFSRNLVDAVIAAEATESPELPLPEPADASGGETDGE